jgi:DNA (cytosine-5)-methyltransferase 1
MPAGTDGKKSKDVDATRYHAIGNAVSVPVVVWIANQIDKARRMEIENRGVKQVVKRFADFNTPKTRYQFYSDLNKQTLFDGGDQHVKVKWLSGGMAFGDEVVDCKVHHSPTNPLKSQLVDIIDEEIPDEKYFISPSAAVGILRRVKSQERELFHPLMDALSRMAAEIRQRAQT